MLRRLLIATTLLLAIPATANARFSADRDLQEMTAVANAYWAEHGLAYCPNGFDWQWADDFPTGVYGQAGERDETGRLVPGACHGWLRRNAFNYPTRSRWTLKYRCSIVVHEMGHAMGLEHTEGGIMDAQYMDVPRVCRDWANSKIAAARGGHRLPVFMARGSGVLR